VIAYRIPFNRPSSEGNESLYIAQAIASGHISGDGPFTRKAEALLEQDLGVPRVLLTPSCTAALEMAAILLDLEHGDEVIVPSFTFTSTVNAFVLRGARPVFADIRADTLNLDEKQLDRLITPRTRAIVPVHYAGTACEMDTIVDVATGAGLAIVEDNAHGLFGRYRGRYLGTIGALATQSFHETKNFTCGEGGALLINDPRYVERAEIIREKGTDRSRFFRGQVDKYTWVDLGSSYLPSEIAAACEQPYHMFFLIMPNQSARDRLISHLRAQGILSVFHYLPLHLSPAGRKFGIAPTGCLVTEDVSDRLVRLPFYNSLSEDEQAIVCDNVDEVLATL
jgi:dTDP-4-amino-4,6-dideoxygalactose transaminase